MWGDEAQAFLIARDSALFSDLFKNVRYEGHPSLWHLLIKLSIFFIPHFYVVQVLNVLAGIGIFTIIYFYSPFRLYQKFLIASSYFISYEWIIVSRCYAIGVFFLLLALVFNQRMQQESKYIFIAVALGLAINSSGHAMIVGVCLGAYLFLSEVNTRQLFLQLFSGKKLTGIFILALSLGLYLLQTYPPGDRLGEEKVNHWNAPASHKLTYSLTNLTKGFFFIQRLQKEQPIWQNDMVVNKYSGQLTIAGKSASDIFYLLAGLICFILICVFFTRKQSLFFFTGATAMLFLGNYQSPYGLNLRHSGFYFLAFIIALWFDTKKTAPQKKMNFILGGILILQFISSLVIHVAEWKYQFSNAKETGRYLKENHFDTLKILGHFWQALPVIAYAETKNYVLVESGHLTSFIKMDTVQYNENLIASANPQRFAVEAKRSGADILLLTPADTIPSPESLGYVRLKAFNGQSIQYFEKYIVYKKVQAKAL